MDQRILVLFLINVIYVCSSPHQANQLEYFCGAKLSDTLTVLCKGNYYTPSKKSLNDLLQYNEYEETFRDENDENQVDFPFLKQEAGNSPTPVRLRRSRNRGIVEQCCHNPCTYNQLRQYCA